MSGLNGYGVCARIKPKFKARHISIIFVSAMGKVEYETRWLDLGSADHMATALY
ncbi:MAG TPA: hypothetical protein PLJ46_01515 [Burkholderiaceae bacterium]|nr:hypothetical protein [Burkholderiaceae bacterium]